MELYVRRAAGRAGHPRRRVALGLAAALTLGACAGVAPEPSFERVQGLVEERAPSEAAAAVSWHRLGAGAEAAVAARLDQLLAVELTAEAAVEAALLASPSLQASLEELGISQAELAEASRPENPTLHAAARFADGGGTEWDLGLGQSLLSLVLRPARKRLAEVRQQGAEAEAAAAVLDLAARVETQYYRALGASQVAAMRRLVWDAAEASWELAAALKEAGNLSDLELQRERLMAESARVELARAELERELERETLHRLLGLGPERLGWRLVDGLPDLPAEEPAFRDLEAAALERRLDLAAAAAAVEARSQALGLTRSWRWFLVAEVGVDAEREVDGEWAVGPELALELPIFDQRQPEIARADAELRRSVHAMNALALEIRSEVRVLSHRLERLRELAAHFREVVLPLKERVVRLTEREYNYMLVGAFELLEAKQEEYDAYRDYLETVRDYWVTRAELRRATGGVSS